MMFPIDARSCVPEPAPYINIGEGAGTGTQEQTSRLAHALV